MAKRGFARLKEKDPEKLKKIASKAGKKAHEVGKAHKFLPGDEATIAAGSKGGQKISQDREHMRQLGVLAGKASAARRRSVEDSLQGRDLRPKEEGVHNASDSTENHEERGSELIGRRHDGPGVQSPDQAD